MKIDDEFRIKSKMVTFCGNKASVKLGSVQHGGENIQRHDFFIGPIGTMVDHLNEESRH